MSDQMVGGLNNGSWVDNGVSSQVGVCHWLVDLCDDWGKTGSIEVWVVVSIVCVVVSWGVENACVSFGIGLTLDEGVSDNVVGGFNNGSWVDNGVSSQVGVSDWSLDLGDDWGNTWNVVVWVVHEWVVSSIVWVVSCGVEEAWVSFSISLTFDQTVVPQGLDGTTFSCDAVVWAIRTDLGNNS